jgi:hypothetical protein
VNVTALKRATRAKVLDTSLKSNKTANMARPSTTLQGSKNTDTDEHGTVNHDVATAAVDIFNKESADSIYWKVSEKLRNKLDQIDPKLFLMTENQLEALVKPGDFEDQIRTAFWEEYERMSLLGSKKMMMTNIYDKICSREFFYAYFLERNDAIAWMLRPTHNYDIRASSLLDLGYRRLSQAMRMPIKDEKGNLIKNNMDIIMRAVQMLDIRIKGMPMQKIQQTSVNLSYKQGVMQSPNQELQQIERELAELKQREPMLIDVKSEHE